MTEFWRAGVTELARGCDGMGVGMMVLGAWLTADWWRGVWCA